MIEGGPRRSTRIGELMEIQPDGSLLPVVPRPAAPPSTSSQEQTASTETEPDSDPEPPAPANEPDPEPAQDPNAEVPRVPRISRWANLLRREPQPTRARNAPTRYQGGSSEQEINAAIHEKNQHQAFITYSEDPETYAEAMNFQYSKEWEKALRVEVKQLEDTGTIKWINEKDIPAD